jgi:branched-chain amino acid transport system ATP-binding protein
VLELRSLSTYYGNIQALKEIDLSVSEGEVITLIGANGAGKSTTLMSISGIMPPQSGEIMFEGESLVGLSPDEIVRRGVIQVPEGRHIFPGLTVQENLDMGALLRRDRDGIAADLEYVFTLFPILKNRRHQAGGTLSGGEQQMLAISRALMARPRLLLLDEPSLGLAPLLVQQIFEIIQKINGENGTTIFLVEQNAYLALKVADRGYVMETGRIKLTDTGENLLENEEIRRAYLGV